MGAAPPGTGDLLPAGRGGGGQPAVCEGGLESSVGLLVCVVPAGWGLHLTMPWCNVCLTLFEHWGLLQL